jgi:hypothetical protein
MLFREPLWLNVQDFPADAASASGISKSSWFNRICDKVQSWLFNRAGVWSSIAPSMVRRLEAIRRHDQQIHYCPNFLNATMAHELTKHASKVDRPVAQRLKLLYAGNIGKKQGLIDFCKVLAATPIDFSFRIQGNGGEAEAIKRWVAHTGDARFRLGEFLDEKGFVAALFETDLFVITEKAGVGASFIPSKLIPCIATGTPVFCVCDRDGPLGTEVVQYHLGYCLPWTEIDQLIERLTETANDHTKLAKMQRNAIDRSHFYTREKVIDTIERELEKLVSPA